MTSKQIFDHPELLKKPLLGMKEAAKKFNPPVSDSTFQRFVRRGVRGVYLKTVTVGNRRFTTMSAIREFLHAQQKTAPEPARSESRKGMSKKMIADLSKKYGLPVPE